ncbi:MAG: VanZ family protein [Lentimicrobium sp.]
MQFFIKNYWPGITWWCFILVLTLAPGNYFPKVGSFWNLFKPDKLIHLFIFGVLAFLLLLGSYKQYRGAKHRYIVVFPLTVTIITGVVTELLQAGLPIGRNANIYDVIANFTGCFVGFFIFSFFRNKNRENILAN